MGLWKAQIRNRTRSPDLRACPIRETKAREDSELATPAIDGVAVTNHIRCDDASSMARAGDERRSISHFGPPNARCSKIDICWAALHGMASDNEIYLRDLLEEGRVNESEGGRQISPDADIDSSQGEV